MRITFENRKNYGLQNTKKTFLNYKEAECYFWKKYTENCIKLKKLVAHRQKK